MRIKLLLLAGLLGITACSRRAGPASVAVQEPSAPAVAAVVEVQQPVAEKINFHRPETWLIGSFTQDVLTRPPHNQWFMSEYEAYKPVQEQIHAIQEAGTAGVTVLIVLGSWCPDSHREVPRFMKVVDECGMARIGVRFLGVDMSKYAPVGDYEKLEIKRVPTFIVYRNNIESGRIIEYPVTSLEGDLNEILRRKNQ